MGSHQINQLTQTWGGYNVEQVVTLVYLDQGKSLFSYTIGREYNRE